MSFLDLIGQLNQSAGQFALIATYEFDPTFFERRVMRTKGFANAERVLVLVDRSRYQELLTGGTIGGGLNRDYLLVPVARSRSIFHPKIYLTLGERRATGIIGSCNCTNAGLAYNMELASTISIALDQEGLPAGPSMRLLRELYEALRAFAEDSLIDSDILDRHYFAPIEQTFPWLNRKVITGPAPSEVELLLSHGTTSLWEQIERRLSDQEVRQIFVLAPFFDPDLALLKRFTHRWKSARLVIVAQPHYSNLPPAIAATLLDQVRGDELWAANPKPGRRLHAKCFAFETLSATYWLSGSANATLAAFDNRNTEACLWFASSNPASSILGSETLPARLINPDQFEPGTDQEPQTPVASGKPSLSLGPIMLDENATLTFSFDCQPDLRNVALRLHDPREEHPFLSFAVSLNESKRCRLLLEEHQVALIRSAVVCQLVGEIDGAVVASNRTALIQLGQLTKQRSPSEPGRNRLEAITESGEHLVAHLDALGTVRDAIEFLDHLRIRFYDGEARGFRGMHGWKPRDPFLGDMPHHWFLSTADHSPEQLRQAIWDFVERHQRDQLRRHVRRGNLNGLPNFLDIFRTLNGLLLTYNARPSPGGGPIVPHPLVTQGIKTNLALLIGPPPDRDLAPEGSFVASIRANLGADASLVRDRMQSERVSEMVRAAVEAMVAVRQIALKKRDDDPWSLRHLKWVSDWISAHGLPQPSPEAIREVGAEYGAPAVAA